MESNNISQQISNIIDNTDTGSSSFISSDSSSGILDSIKNMGITTWIIIILIFSFLGFNIFTLLAKGTDEVSSILQPITNIFASIFGSTTAQIVDVSAEGGKAVTNTTASVINTGLNAAQKVANQTQTTTTQQTITNVKGLDNAQVNTLNKALNSSAPLTTKSDDYQEDDSSSSIQRGTSKTGWCYIGEDRGFRTCSQVGPNDDCMSGDIFPSNEICMNPSLRA
jgi:hypothetical protein